jgi:hypothetical protein
MASPDRRLWLAGAGAMLISAYGVGAASGRTPPAKDRTRMYDYLFFDLAPSAEGAPAAALAQAARAALPPTGEILGLFTPQLGWRARQAALLVRWAQGAAGREAALTALGASPGVAGVVHDRLEPTLRPAAGDRPPPGGIYVHRWFVVETASVPEFLELSAQGWRDFEARFDTRIFGLFAAAQTEADAAAAVTRLLLVTRYGDHGVWEASRDPSTEAMAAFARRRRLTRDTWAASTLLSPVQGA